MFKVPGFKRKKENGSATIEAVVCLSLFLFLMMFFIMIVQLTVTQTIMQNALNQTAKELSQDLYLYDAFGLVNFRQSVSEENSKAVAKADEIQDAFKSISSFFPGSSGAEAVKDDFLENFSLESLETGGKTVINAALNSLVSAGENALVPVLFKKYVSSDGTSGTADAYLKRLNVAGGINGLSFSKSSMFGTWSLKKADNDSGTPADTEVEEDMDSEASGESGTVQGDKNTINLVLEYKVKILHPLQGWKEVNCIQSSATRVWTGDNTGATDKKDNGDGEDTEDEDEKKFAYYTPKGERYHPDRHCMTLARSKEVNKVTVKAAKARGLTICGVCGSK